MQIETFFRTRDASLKTKTSRKFKDVQLFKKQSPTPVFPVDIAKFFKNSFLKQHLWWLLLTVLLRYSKVSWGACS